MAEHFPILFMCFSFDFQYTQCRIAVKPLRNVKVFSIFKKFKDLPILSISKIAYKTSGYQIGIARKLFILTFPSSISTFPGNFLILIVSQKYFYVKNPKDFLSHDFPKHLVIYLNILDIRNFEHCRKGGATNTNLDNSVGPKQSSISIVLNKNGRTGWWNLDKILSILNNCE